MCGFVKNSRSLSLSKRRDVVNRMMSNIRQNLRYSGLAALLAQALPPEQENL